MKIEGEKINPLPPTTIEILQFKHEGQMKILKK